jgi:hypothetical protein
MDSTGGVQIATSDSASSCGFASASASVFSPASNLEYLETSSNDNAVWVPKVNIALWNGVILAVEKKPYRVASDRREERAGVAPPSSHRP